MSRRKLDQLLVLDIESSCWLGNPPKGQLAEIIEIGITEYDIQLGTISQPTSIIVKPIMSTISKFCTDLTGLTQFDVDKGISFNKACQRLQEEFKSRKRVWASWGVYDRIMIERQCGRMGIRYPMNVSHINLKTYFAIVRKMKSECGQARALSGIGLEFEGRPHSGAWDSYNAARVLGWILNKREDKNA